MSFAKAMALLAQGRKLLQKAHDRLILGQITIERRIKCAEEELYETEIINDSLEGIYDNRPPPSQLWDGVLVE